MHKVAHSCFVARHTQSSSFRGISENPHRLLPEQV
jgi:hypothetical protein|eukprot:COSAG06_NODE_883_length_11788_cov_4.031568_3_plen_35_part_00